MLAIKSVAHLKLTRMFEIAEVGFYFDCVIEILQKLPLECHDFLDVAEQGIDLSVRQEGLALQRFQIVFQQIVQILKTIQFSFFF